jgi:hypothetical protein
MTRGDIASGYRLIPFAERWGEVDWRAGVILNIDAARGARETKSTYCKPFVSKEEALRFARAQCEQAVGVRRA